MTVPTDKTETRSVDVSSTPAQAGPAHAIAPGLGTILKGKYRLDSKIGEGGMGVVYKALDLDMGDPDCFVALKLINPTFTHAESINSLKKEVLITKNLHNDCIVDVAGFEQDRGLAFMVMEYLIGRPLDRVIAEQKALGMSFRSAWHIIEDMGAGLTCAHKSNVIHSDFKPSNVFVTAAFAKVLDFGIARAAGAPLQGISVAYASCEMLEGTQKEDPRDDVYAFGLVVYKLLSGKHPFCDEHGNEMRATWARDAKMPVPPIKGLTRRQHNALKGALSFERQKRTKSIQEVVDELKREEPPVLLWTLMGLLLAGAVAAGSLYAYRQLGPQDCDPCFIAELINSQQPKVSDMDDKTIKELLELAAQFVQDGSRPVDPGLLSENPGPLSSAFATFQEVRKSDPANLTAATGLLTIADLYKAEARRLLKADRYREAAEMVRLGLKIWPDSTDLKNLDQQIRARTR